MKVLKIEPSNTGDIDVIICGQRAKLKSGDIQSELNMQDHTVRDLGCSQEEYNSIRDRIERVVMHLALKQLGL